MNRIDVTRLGDRVRLADGGHGTVYQLTRAPHPGWQVYKEYHEAVAESVDPMALKAMIELEGGLNPDVVRWLRSRTAWPQAVVFRGGQVSGVLMPQIPTAFRLAVGPANRGTPDRPAGIEFLLNPSVYRRRIGLAINDRDRVDLLLDVAECMHRLHRLGVVVGDLSPKNVLFATADGWRSFFLDCDSMWLDGRSSLTCDQTPDWGVPEGRDGRPPTPNSDVFKFALLVVRLFAGDQTAMEPERIPARFLGLRHLASASLAADPSTRPTIRHWRTALARARAVERVFRPPDGRPSGAVRHDTPHTTPAPAQNRALVPRRAYLRGLAALVAICGVLGAVVLAGTVGRGRTPAPPQTGSADRCVPSGVVDTTAVRSDPRAAAVAALLDRYFTAANARRPDQAVVLFDPANRLAPIHPGRFQRFAASLPSDHTNVRLLGLGPASGSTGMLTADVAMRTGCATASGSASGCRQRRILYLLSRPPPGEYRIFSTRATSRRC